MLTADLRVNGVLVAHVYIRNLMDRVGQVDTYAFEIYRPESGVIKTGTVTHNRDNGAEDLIVKVLTDTDEEDDSSTEFRYGASAPMDIKKGV